MRRLFVAATVCAAFLLVTGGASAGTQRHVNGGVHPGPGAAAPAPDAGFSKARFAPLGAKLAATATVAGTLYDSYHNALSGKTVEWDSWSTADQTWYWDTTTTAADGSYSMTALATGIGEVWAYPDDDTMFARLDQTWSAGGSYSVPLYPGRVAVSATRGGPWTGSSSSPCTCTAIPPIRTRTWRPRTPRRRPSTSR